MIVDASAVVAVLRAEPDAQRYAEALASSTASRMSAVNWLEAAIVVGNDLLVSRRFDDFLSTANVQIEPVTAEQAQVARRAYRDLGRCSGHPARLNLGDCSAYALASVTGEPLLFKGDDFTRTDLVAALPTDGSAERS